ESFWTDFAHSCEHVRARRAFAELKPDIDALLRAYLRVNGNYRSNSVLQSAFRAMGNSSAGVSWIVDLSAAAPEPVQVLLDIAFVPWIPVANRGPIYQRILEGKQKALESAEGLEKENALSELSRWQLRWAQYL